MTLTLSNNGTADAFDAAIEDVLDPAKFANVTAGAAPAGFVDASAGNVVRYNALPGFALAEGAVAVFTFTAEITDAIVPGEIITNTATVVGGNTLPGGGGASRDVSGDTGIDTTEVTLGLGKSIVATSEAHTTGIERVAVGEIVRFRLVIELPEAAATDLTLQDLLPVGLQFIDPHAALDDSARIAFVSNGGLSSAGAVGIVAPGAFVTGDETTVATITPTFALADLNISSVVDADVDTYVSGSDVFFRLGDVVNADSDANAEFIVIEYNALVINEAGNVAGAALDNSFRALSDDNGPNTQIGADSPLATVTVTEPAISIAKSLTSGAGDAGVTVVYPIVISNAAGADVASGFEVRVQDDLDALDAGVLTLVSAVFDPGTSGASVIADASAGNLVDLTLDRLDPGTSATVTITATLAADLAAGRSVDNAASLVYSGLPGSAGTAVNPTGSALAGAPGAGDGERDGSGGVNDYTGATAASFTVTPPAVDKRLVDEATTSATIGDTVVYDLVVTLPEGRSENLRISDAVPDGLAVVAAELITSAAGSAYLAGDFVGSIENAGAAAAVTAQDSGVDLLLDFG
ncbi:MAG: isopeptide-forming domain-containing fimbrial protein, partial [Gammaproteobacteria bacterium]